MSTTITVCETCKRTNWNAEIDNKTDGEVLADLIESMSDEAPNINIRSENNSTGRVVPSSEGPTKFEKRRFNVTIQKSKKDKV